MDAVLAATERNRVSVTKIGFITLLLLFSCGFTECYKPVTNSGLPEHIKTVAVPAFQFEARASATRSSRDSPTP